MLTTFRWILRMLTNADWFVLVWRDWFMVLIELLGDWLIIAEKFQTTWEGEKGRCLMAESLGVEQRNVLSSLWVGEPWLDWASVLGNLLSECKLAQIDGAWEDEITWGHRGCQVTKRRLSADCYKVTVPFRSNIGCFYGLLPNQWRQWTLVNWSWSHCLGCLCCHGRFLLEGIPGLGMEPGLKRLRRPRCPSKSLCSTHCSRSWRSARESRKTRVSGRN